MNKEGHGVGVWSCSEREFYTDGECRVRDKVRKFRKMEMFM